MTAAGEPAVVVITGASAGVGRATARRFGRAGCSIGLIARDLRGLEDTKAEVEAVGGRAIAVPADVADADAVFRAAERVEAELGPVDVWINNAMVTVFSPFHAIRPEEFRRVTEVTYLGAVHGTMAALRQMQPRKRGTIIQVGSALAYRGIPLQAAYCGAKHALRGFTDSLRTELIHDASRIELVMVHLPAVNTPQFDWARTHLGREPRPVPPVVQPEVVAAALFRAAHRPQREIWLGLSTIEAILANMMAPGLLDRYLAHRAYESQSRESRTTSDRADNLFRPVPALHRSRGCFGAEARNSSIAASGRSARVATLLAGLGLGATLGYLLRIAPTLRDTRSHTPLFSISPKKPLHRLRKTARLERARLLELRSPRRRRKH